MSRPKKSAVRAAESARNAALLRLMGAIFEHEEAGELVPCVDPRRGHLWLSEREADQEAASWRCQPCPVLAECRAYITHHPEPAGVWAGLTFADRRQNNRRTA